MGNLGQGPKDYSLMRLLRFVLTISCLLTLNAAFAQADLGTLFAPRPKDLETELQLNLRVFGTGEISDTSDSLGLDEYELRFRVPVHEDERQTLSAGVAVYGLHLDMDGLLAPGIGLPSDLYDVSASLAYRRELDRGWTLGCNLQFGSASAKVFDSSDGLYLRATGLLRIPNERNAWLVLLHADTRFEWPVFPGFGYQWRFERGHYLALGLPFLATGVSLTERLHFEAAYFPINNVRAALRYKMTDSTTPYLAFSWNSHYFKRADHDADEHLEFEDKRIAAGVAFNLGKHARLDFEAGYAFDRSLDEYEDWDHRDKDKIDLEDAGFLGASFRSRF